MCAMCHCRNGSGLCSGVLYVCVGMHTSRVTGILCGPQLRPLWCNIYTQQEHRSVDFEGKRVLPHGGVLMYKPIALTKFCRGATFLQLDTGTRDVSPVVVGDSRLHCCHSAVLFWHFSAHYHVLVPLVCPLVTSLGSKWR